MKSKNKIKLDIIKKTDTKELNLEKDNFYGKKHKTKIVAFVLAFVFIFSSVCLFACKKKKDNLEVMGEGLTNYYIDLEYNSATNSALGNCEIDYVNSSEALLKEVKIHLYIASFCRTSNTKVVNDINFNKAFYNGQSYASLNISRVNLNGEDVGVYYENEDNDILVVELKSSLYPSERVNIKIEYSFSLPNINHRFGYGENTINFGNFYPIVCVYDGGWKTDSYCATGDPFCSDMANYYVTLITEDKFTLASTGYVKEKVNDQGATIYNIEAKCVRDFAFVLSDKFKTTSKIFNGVTINYYYTSDENFEKTLQCAVDSIKTFNELFYIYPYPCYSVAQVDFCYGGMEYPNLSLVSNAIDNYDDYLNVVVHETAHQWWYNLIGNDEYNESWLDEAITEFSCLIFYDENEGYNFKHEDMITAVHDNYLLYESVYKNVLGELDSSMTRPVNKFNTEPEYTFSIYVKGVLMYESLYQLVGRDKFVKSLRLYADNNKFKIAKREDLISAFEQGCNTNLENFFDCWLSGRVVIQ